MFDKTKEKVQAVKELPQQIRLALSLAISALFVSLLSLGLFLVGGRRAN